MDKQKKFRKIDYTRIIYFIGCLILIPVLIYEGIWLRGIAEIRKVESQSHYADLGEEFLDPVEQAMADMTDREKVGQLFIVNIGWLNLTESDRAINFAVTEVMDNMRAAFERYPVGGVSFTYNNIGGEEEFLKMTEDMHALGNGSVHPWVCCDEEGGSVTRMAVMGCFDLPTYPNMQYIAEHESLEYAYDMGKTIGEYMTRYGVDLNFAPIADVNSNPNNPIIGSRAFGSDPVIAAEYVAAVTKGFHDGGVLTCLKHYPGHGDTANDTHSSAGITYKNWDELMECEMRPFISGIEAGADCIMTAHIKAPNVTGNDLMTTFSYELITEKLRNELGFEGLIMTDGLQMGAVSDYYSTQESAVLAIQAGCDILLMPSNLPDAFNGVMDALEDGTLSMERIEESVYRILKVKLGYDRPVSRIKTFLSEE